VQKFADKGKALDGLLCVRRVRVCRSSFNVLRTGLGLDSLHVVATQRSIALTAVMSTFSGAISQTLMTIAVSTTAFARRYNNTG
jgi:hypothetical protein